MVGDFQRHANPIIPEMFTKQNKMLAPKANGI